MIPVGILGSGISGSGYLATAVSMGALRVMDGFDDAIYETAYQKVGTVTAVADDPYGHKALLCSDSAYLTPQNVDVLSPGSFTLVGATSLVDGSTATYSRLVVFGNAFIGRAGARTTTSVGRHDYTADPGTWHWFAFTVDHSGTSEISKVYRDGQQFGSTITRNDVTPPSGNQITQFGSADVATRNVGHFSACSIIRGVLTAQQVADLYAAYQRGL